MILTSEQFNILASIVVDPQAWADHAESVLGEGAVLAKIDKYRAPYEAEHALLGYQTRAEREAETP